MPGPEELLAAYVEAHNEGVRSGDYSALADLLLPTASMRFSGIAAGPFDSAAAILQAFREKPPDDELVAVTVRRVGEQRAEARMRWEEIEEDEWSPLEPEVIGDGMGQFYW